MKHWSDTFIFLKISIRKRIFRQAEYELIGNFASTNNESYYMKYFSVLFPAFFFGLFARAQEVVRLTVSSDVSQQQAPVTLNVRTHKNIRSATVRVNGRDVACQLDDLDRDGQYDELSFLTDIKESEVQHVVVNLSDEEWTTAYPARTYAEMMLRNPKVKEKNKHDIYLTAITLDASTKDPFTVLHHHGVAFENDLVAMRIYMDARQTIDLYGKFHQGLELYDTQFYTSPAQKAQGYGDDVLWVGNTFGLGALRGWDGQPSLVSPVKQRSQRIICAGPIRTIVEMADEEWAYKAGEAPINMILRYTLYAGHRDFEVEASFNRDLSSSLFSTGVINVRGSEEFSDKDGLRGCWGTDWPATDTLNWKRETVGLGIFVPTAYRDREWPATKDNYTFTVKPVGCQLRYHLAYTSDNEDYGYHTAKTWFAFLKDWKKRLLHPLKVKVER